MRWFSQPGMDTHRSRGIEISETCPSFGRRMLTRTFGSMVGRGVSVGGGTVGVGVQGSNVGVDSNVPVGVLGSGWKGVGVGEAFGAAVTSVKGRAGGSFAAADANV